MPREIKPGKHDILSTFDIDLQEIDNADFMLIKDAGKASDRLLLAAIFHAKFASAARVFLHDGRKSMKPVHAMKHDLAIAITNGVVDHQIPRSNAGIKFCEHPLRLDDQPTPPAEIKMKTHIICNRMAASDIHIKTAALVCENAFQMVIL
ncbi:MAG: hypothetical protein MUF11_04265 [Beijerinckiaceae bacterium]|nr:hypothetical protein [Beijerinckiaceae bacterium]